MKTSDLIGPPLDWAVTFALHGEQAKYIFKYAAARHRYSTSWSQGGPVIEEWAVSLSPDEFVTGNTRWCAVCTNEGEGFEQFGPTALIAAMRCFVSSKLGDEIEIPQELTA